MGEKKKKNHKKNTWNFGYSLEDTGQCPGADLWQIPRQLFLHVCPKSEPDSCLGIKLFLSQLLTISYVSLGNLHHKLSFRNYFYFCVKNNRIKNQKKGSWLVKHEWYQDKIWALISQLQFKPLVLRWENVEGATWRRPLRETGGPTCCKQGLTRAFFPFHASQETMVMKTPIDLQKITFLRTSIWTAKKQHQFQTKLKSLPPPGPRTASVPECTALERSPSRALGANSLASSDLAPNRVFFQSRSKELCTVQWYIPGGH